jgi:hypothetical protein
MSNSWKRHDFRRQDSRCKAGCLTCAAAVNPMPLTLRIFHMAAFVVGRAVMP